MLVALMLAAYLRWWPVPVDAAGWRAPPAPGYAGPHAANQRLQGLHTMALQGEEGPEHVALSADGSLYTGVASGKILRVPPGGGAPRLFAATGGRPLGMAFDAHGDLIVADAVKGLLSIAADGRVTLLADTVDGQALVFLNAVTVARDGKIYFTDSSTRFAPARWGGTLAAATLDVLEQSATGRVLEYDPATRGTRVLAYGLSLANGVALSADERSLFVAESGRYRVWKIAATAEKWDLRRTPAPAGAGVLLDNLPGYPDNLLRGLDGKIWLGLAGPRNQLDALADSPRLREAMLRVPRALWGTPRAYGHVMAFTEQGVVVDDRQDPAGASGVTTGVTETAERLYIHSVDSKSLGWLAR